MITRMEVAPPKFQFKVDQAALWKFVLAAIRSTYSWAGPPSDGQPMTAIVPPRDGLPALCFTLHVEDDVISVSGGIDPTPLLWRSSLEAGAQAAAFPEVGVLGIVRDAVAQVRIRAAMYVASRKAAEDYVASLPDRTGVTTNVSASGAVSIRFPSGSLLPFPGKAEPEKPKEIKQANGSTITVDPVAYEERVRGLPREVIDSVRALINYNWDNEEEDYEERPEDEKTGHVFEHMKRLDAWFAGPLLPGIDVIICTKGGLVEQVYARDPAAIAVVVDHDKDAERPYSASEPDVAPIDGDGGLASAQCGDKIIAAVQTICDENNGVSP